MILSDFAQVVHQEEALTDCLIIEASTPHYNDRVRVEKKYFLAEEPGLESTSIEDVKDILNYKNYQKI